jgi:hypothetical protein
MKIIESGEYRINMCRRTVFCTVLTSCVFQLVCSPFIFAGSAWSWFEGRITLLPLTPNEIVQCDRAIAETTRRESEIQHASSVKHEQRTLSLNSNAIKLKSRAMLTTKSDLTVSTNVDVSFHALVCQ